MDNTQTDSTEEHGFFLTESEISDNFDLVQKAWRDYEDCNITMPYESAIQILKQVENSIIRHGMFSPNEDVKEIPTENLKYLLLPFYLADIFGRSQEGRRSNLTMSKKYYDEFIKLCNHYELVSKEQRKKWKTVYDDVNYEPSREDKIQGFKDKKDLENKIKNLEQIKDEDSRREVLILDIKTKILRAIDDIRMVHLEGQMHDHKEKLEKERQQDPQAADAREKQVPKKMSVYHIPKPDKNPQQPYLVSNKDWGCHKCDPMYNVKVKEEMKQGVFKNVNGPTLSLEDYANMVMKMDGEMEERNKEAAAERAKEEEKDQDKDEISDRKTLEERAWDDWKDANEKGGGNKNKNR